MMRPDALLFGESQSRVVVSVKEKDLGRLRDIAAKEGAPLQVLGEVGGPRLAIQPLLQLPVEELRMAWAGALERRIKGD